ncbi:MAG: F0F1 ATP synthase subunit A [Planctomycetota bacterium]|nr:MAG: F0F1 ATP synthase subunit A [Planctomycetota bacterium]
MDDILEYPAAETAETVDASAAAAVELEQSAPTAEAASGGFSFIGALKHHSLPWPAWDPTGRPLLIFNSPKYADYAFKYLKVDPAFGTVEPTASQLTWAGEYVLRVQELREGELAFDANSLAQAMALAENQAVIGTFPKPLAFFNHMTFFGSVALLLVALFVCVWGRRRPEQLKPVNRVQHMIEAVTIYIRNEVVRPNIHHGDAWTAHFTAIFFAVLAFNLFGLVPGGGAASAHIAITGAFAFATLVTMLFCGMRAQGVGTYWKTLVPVPFTLNPMGLGIWLILAVIEVAGLIIKPAALAIRLFANMFAGHVVVLSFTTLFFIVISAGASEIMATALGGFGILIAVAIFLLKLLVSFIQAYVFTLLSALFVGASVHPDH